MKNALGLLVGETNFGEFEKTFTTKFAKSNEFDDDIFAKLGFRVEICKTAKLGFRV